MRHEAEDYCDQKLAEWRSCSTDHAHRRRRTGELQATTHAELVDATAPAAAEGAETEDGFFDQDLA